MAPASSVQSSNEASRNVTPLTFAGIGSQGSNPCRHERREATASAEAKAQKAANDAISEELRGQSSYKDFGLGSMPTSAVLNAGTGENMTRDFEETFFTDAAAARAYRPLLLGGRAKEDPTIPTTEKAKRAHVKALFIAFKSATSECSDTEEMKRLFVNEHHDNRLVEARCWDIYNAIENASRFKDNIVESYEPHKYKYKHSAWNFATRFDEVCRVLATTKSLAKRAFDAPFLIKFVDDPTHNKTRTESNRTLNAKKSNLMKRGREEEERDEKLACEAKGEEYKPPVKRRKTTAAKKPVAPSSPEPQTREVRRRGTNTSEPTPSSLPEPKRSELYGQETFPAMPAGSLPVNDPEYARQAGLSQGGHQVHVPGYLNMSYQQPPAQMWPPFVPGHGQGYHTQQTPGLPDNGANPQFSAELSAQAWGHPSHHLDYSQFNQGPATFGGPAPQALNQRRSTNQAPQQGHQGYPGNQGQQVARGLHIDPNLQQMAAHVAPMNMRRDNSNSSTSHSRQANPGPSADNGNQMIHGMNLQYRGMANTSHSSPEDTVIDPELLNGQGYGQPMNQGDGSIDLRKLDYD